MAIDHGNGSGSSNSKGNGAKKRWNQVAATARNRKGKKGAQDQKGIFHHAEKRRVEMIAAVCEYPDLLLKMVLEVMKLPDLKPAEAAEFGSFFAGLGEECILASFGKKGLDATYDNLWEEVYEQFPTFVMSGCVISLASTVAKEANPHISSILRRWISFPQDGILADLIGWIDGDDHEMKEGARWDLARIYLSLTSSGFIPRVVNKANDIGKVVPGGTVVIRDPKRLLELEITPWVVEDPELRKRLRTLIAEFQKELGTSPGLLEHLGKVADDEAEIADRLRVLWAAMRVGMQRWIVGDDLFHLDYGDDGVQPLSTGVLEAVVEPIGYTYPSLGLRLRLYSFGYRWEETLVIGEDGVPILDDFSADDPDTRLQRAFRLWLCMRAEMVIGAGTL